MHLRLIWLLLLFPILILGQEIDSLQDHIDLGIYPAISYTPETNLSFGAFALMVLKNKSNPNHYTPNLISPKMAYSLNNQLILASIYEYPRLCDERNNFHSICRCLI